MVPPPPLNRALEWVIGLQRVSASQNSSAPLGPNAFSACTAGSSTFGCTALIDSGTFSIALPPQLIFSLLLLLGLPPFPPLVGIDITGRALISAAGYPQISCDARDRPGPTIDFQIQVRGISSVTLLTMLTRPHQVRGCKSATAVPHMPMLSIVQAQLYGMLVIIHAQYLPLFRQGFAWNRTDHRHGCSAS